MNRRHESRISRLYRLHGVRLLVPAAIAVVIGFILYIWRPLWFAPPHHASTPLLYLLLALAWIPLWAYAVWRLPRHRLLVAVLGFLLAQLTCAAGFALSPHAYYELLHMRREDHGSLEYGSLEEQDCSLQDQVFTCELAIGSSDNDRAVFLSYRFEMIANLPIMRLTSFSSRLGCNPAYASCSSAGSP